MRTDHANDQELRDLVPWPRAVADYDPDSDADRFGEAWSEWETVPEGEEPKDGHLLLEHWQTFAMGAGVFDLYCEVKGNIVQVPKRADSLEAKSKPSKSKKPSKSSKKISETRAGYLPLQIDKQLAMSHYPKPIRSLVDCFSVKIKVIVAQLQRLGVRVGRIIILRGRLS